MLGKVALAVQQSSLFRYESHSVFPVFEMSPSGDGRHHLFSMCAVTLLCPKNNDTP